MTAQVNIKINLNLTAVKFMGSLGFQHTELHLVCIIKAHITVYNSVGTNIEARRKCTFIRIPKMRIKLTFIISFLAGDDMRRS